MRPWPTPWSIRLAAAVALAVDPTAAWAAPPDEMLFERAFTYAFPLQEMALLRARLTAAAQGASAPGGGSPAAARPAGAAAPPAGAPTVGWRHVRTLSGPNDRAVTTPNNDTLYSTAWLDLSRRPVRITVPELQGRYYSIALLDPFTNNFEMIGRRTVGTRPATFLLVGPAWTGTCPKTSVWSSPRPTRC